MTGEDIMISLKACSNQVQDLPWCEKPDSVARAATLWPRIAHCAASTFCTPQEETCVGA
jgi:hypothetical protein